MIIGLFAALQIQKKEESIILKNKHAFSPKIKFLLKLIFVIQPKSNA
jgi:hypothetical protein